MEDWKVELKELNEMTGNPRKISKDELEKLVYSIKEYTCNMPDYQETGGFRLITPIVINSLNNNVIGGHQRLKALRELNQYWIHKNDIRWIDIKDTAKEKALNLALNKISGEWDAPKLDEWLNDLYINDFDMNLTGFSDEELYDYLDIDFMPKEPSDIQHISKKETSDLIKFEIGQIKGYIKLEIYNNIVEKINSYRDEYELLEVALEKMFEEVPNG